MSFDLRMRNRDTVSVDRRSRPADLNLSPTIRFPRSVVSERRFSVAIGCVAYNAVLLVGQPLTPSPIFVHFLYSIRGSPRGSSSTCSFRLLSDSTDVAL